MKMPNPPRIASQFLRWFCSEELYEEIQGDLQEAYYYRIKYNGSFIAKFQYYLDVIRFFKPYSFEKYSRTKQFLPMWKNYIKIALRNILKKKGFTIINLGGLTISLTVILMVGLFLKHHLTYDYFYPESERTYRLENDFRSQSYAPFRFEEYYNSDRMMQLKNKQFLESFSWIENAAYLLQSDAAISRQEEYFLEIDDREIIVEKVLFTNTAEDFMNLFPQPFLQGSSADFTDDFQRVLLTERLAERIFGKDWPSQKLIGTNFRMEAENLENSNYTIAGVIKDARENSHFTFTMIAHTPRIPSWGAYTYFRTSQQKDPAKLTEMINTRYKEIEPDFGEDERYKGVKVQNIRDIHTSTSEILYELRPKVDPTVLGIFATVAIVILFITWTNYMNLSIAMYSNRQKEIGLRKVLGAQRKDVISQLLLEIVIIALLALPISFAIVALVLPVFSELMQIRIPLNELANPLVIFGVVGITLITGILSGLYPALIFSRKHLLSLFRSRIGQANGKYGFGMRRILVGFQFLLLVALLSITAFIFQQLNYIQTKDLGFEEQGVLTIPSEGIEAHKEFKAILRSNPFFEQIGTGRIPGTNRYNQTTYLLEGKTEVFDDANVIYADRETMEAIGVSHPSFEMLENGKDRVQLINQALAENLINTYDLTEKDLVGMTLIEEPEYTDPETGQVGDPTVINGILPNMHYFSLRYEVNPMIFEVYRDRNWAFNSVLKIKPGADIREAILAVEEAYYQAGNERPFEYSFLDENIDQLYKSDQRSMWLMTALSGIAILLSVVGLIGLVSFITYTRKKEIGIRKVFGASVPQILFLINKEFVLLIILATLLAIPITLTMAGNWLQNFSYRIELNPMIIGFAGLIALVIVTAVVSLQSWKTAESNPNEVLVEE